MGAAKILRSCELLKFYVDGSC